MSLEVSLRAGETQESLLMRFQKAVQHSGILREVKTHSYYISRGEAMRIKAKKSDRKRRRQNYQRRQIPSTARYIYQ